MEAWKTYAPDGRALEVEYEDGEWIALCDGNRSVGSTAREAISAALGPRAASIGTTQTALEAWVEAHAARLEAEAAG